MAWTYLELILALIYRGHFLRILPGIVYRKCTGCVNYSDTLENHGLCYLPLEEQILVCFDELLLIVDENEITKDLRDFAIKHYISIPLWMTMIPQRRVLFEKPMEDNWINCISKQFYDIA